MSIHYLPEGQPPCGITVRDDSCLDVSDEPEQVTCKACQREIARQKRKKEGDDSMRQKLAALADACQDIVDLRENHGKGANVPRWIANRLKAAIERAVK